MRIGILGTSEIALRRFMPALSKCGSFEFAGVASRSLSRTTAFTDVHGGRGYAGYDALLDDASIDAIYLPLPPALHFEWAKKALERGKHVMLEKPFTIRLSNTQELVKLAQDKNLAVHENYMFQYHSQIDWIRSKFPEIGELRLIRIDFGFPFRGKDDFRYDKKLGGGAFLDCGGYTLKLASLLLGEDAKLTVASSGYKTGFDVDIFGSATMVDGAGLTAQLSFGMDNSYRCSLDVWGSNGTISTGRILTAPDNFEPVVTIKIGDDVREHKLPCDDSFAKSIHRFSDCVCCDDVRRASYSEILKQAEIQEQFKEASK